MPKFRFKLEVLLSVRKQAERRHQLVVAAIERERLQIEDKLRAQQQRLTEGKSELREDLVGAVNVDALRHQASSALQVVRDAQRMVLELAGVHKRLEAARELLIEAAKQRRVLERLRERRWQEFNEMMEKRETADLDELAVMRAARRECDV